MGLRGPAPKLTAIRIWEGNPSKRPFNAYEPRPAATTPRCPAHLDKEAKKEWRRMVRILRDMKILSAADGHALANLCIAYSTLARAQKKLNETGLLVKAPSGYPVQSPLIGIINSCIEIIHKIGREFGLTSSSRRRLQVNEASVIDELEAVLSAG